MNMHMLLLKTSKNIFPVCVQLRYTCRMAKKKKVKRREIRINDPSDVVYETVTKLAEENKRSSGKQAEFMLEEIIKKALLVIFILCLSACARPSDHDVDHVLGLAEQRGQLRYTVAMQEWCISNGVYVNVDAIDSICKAEGGK